MPLILLPHDTLLSKGFGAIYPGDPPSGYNIDRLQDVEVRYFSKESCDYFLPQFFMKERSMYVCTLDYEGYRSTCRGDSGGPLYDAENDVVVGVTAFGPGGCDFPLAVFTKVASGVSIRFLC